MPKLQERNGQYMITLPYELVIKKGWKKGEALFLSFNERGNIEIQ